MIAAALLLQAAAPPAVATPCRWEERTAGTTFVHFGPERSCVAWQASRRRAGVWVFGFEDSQFVEGATTIDQAMRTNTKSPHAAWVVHDQSSGIPTGCWPLLGYAYRIDFDGRDAAPRATPARADPPSPFGAGFGHMGLWSNMVIVDRVHSIRLLGPLPGNQVRPAGVTPRCTGRRRRVSSDSRR